MMDLKKHKKVTTCLTIFAIICAGVSTILILIGFSFYSESLEPDTFIDSVFGLGSTFFAFISIILAFIDIIFLVNDGLFKKRNLLKFISLLVIAFIVTQIVLFSYQATKRKRSMLYEDSIDAKNNSSQTFSKKEGNYN